MSTLNSELFAERLRQMREQRKLSQAALGERAAMQPAAISHFESGRRVPTLENLKKLADALEITTDYLMGRTNSIEAQSSGPTLDRIYRYANTISESDLETLANFAEVLAKKAEQEKSKL